MMQPRAASSVPKNARGRVLFLEEDIAAAFKMLNRRGAGAGGAGGRVSLAALAERLAALQPGATRDDARQLLGEDPKAGLTNKLLTDLLLDNTISSFDPAAAAFKAFDPQGRGYIDSEVRALVRAAGKGRGRCTRTRTRPRARTRARTRACAPLCALPPREFAWPATQRRAATQRLRSGCAAAAQRLRSGAQRRAAARSAISDRSPAPFVATSRASTALSPSRAGAEGHVGWPGLC